MIRMRNDSSTRRLAAMATIAGTAAAVALVLPWVRTGDRSRSSIDLIGTAGALDVIEGSVRTGVVITWFLVPVLVAGAMLAGAADRLRLCAVLLVPLGPLLAGVILVAALRAGDGLVWGAYLTGACSAAATTLAAVVLRRLRIRGSAADSR